MGQPQYVYTNPTFYSPFEENFWEIVNYTLPPTKKPPLKNLIAREKCPQKNPPDEPPLPENSLQGNLGCILGPIWDDELSDLTT